MYQLVRGVAGATLIRRLADGAVIPRDEANTDYAEFLVWEADGNTPDAADPEPDPEPTRDERLLDAVVQAKDALRLGGFTAQQQLVLSGIFDRLGQAISGGDA